MCTKSAGHVQLAARAHSGQRLAGPRPRWGSPAKQPAATAVRKCPDCAFHGCEAGGGCQRPGRREEAGAKLAALSPCHAHCALWRVLRRAWIRLSLSEINRLHCKAHVTCGPGPSAGRIGPGRHVGETFHSLPFQLETIPCRPVGSQASSKSAPAAIASSPASLARGHRRTGQGGSGLPSASGGAADWAQGGHSGAPC